MMKHISIIVIIMINLTLRATITVDTESHVVSQSYATPCDKQYVFTMERVLTDLRERRKVDLALAQEYMIALKRYQDLQFRINYLQDAVFTPRMITYLRAPLEGSSNLIGNYNTCRSGVKPGIVSPACDNQYNLEMQRRLADLKKVFPNITQRQLRLAEEYMINIKQYQDLFYRINILEVHVFGQEAINALRIPLEGYNRCRDALRSGTYIPTIY